jgi:hypothetical protein
MFVHPGAADALKKGRLNTLSSSLGGKTLVIFVTEILGTDFLPRLSRT